MSKINIDMSELEIAFSTGNELVSFYLDTETGKVIMVSDEDTMLLDTIYQDYTDEDTETVDWERAFREEDVQEWQTESLLEADRVAKNENGLIIPVPKEDPHEAYNDMAAFIVTVRSTHLQEQLENDISGRGAFKRFKNTLLDHPAERERWFKFKQDRQNQRMLDWLEGVGISTEE